jgi:hypothetical protein
MTANTEPQYRNVRLTFVWEGGYQIKIVVVPDKEPTPDTLKASIAEIWKYLTEENTVMLNDKDGKVTSIINNKLIAIEASVV